MTVLTPEIETVAPSSSQHLLKELPHEKLAWMLQRMCEIRYFEEKAEDLYVRGLVHGTMHLSIGQEAASVGSIATLRPEDLLTYIRRSARSTTASEASPATAIVAPIETVTRTWTPSLSNHECSTSARDVIISVT